MLSNIRSNSIYYNNSLQVPIMAIRNDFIHQFSNAMLLYVWQGTLLGNAY